MENIKNNSGPLPGEFPAVSTPEWEEKIKTDLRGADYEKKLVWETHDRFRIRPYYRSEDLEGINYLESLPAQFPYLRGSKSEDNSWLVRQNIPVQDPDTANRYAREIIGRGVTSIGFDLTGLEKLSESDIFSLLTELPLEKVPVNFLLTGQFREVLEWTGSYAEQNNIDPSLIQGSISLDPLGHLASTGNYRREMMEDFSDLGDCLEFCKENLPGFRVIHTNGNLFHDAGASISQTLAFTIAMGNEYLVQLKAMDYPLKEILAHMQFQFSIGSSYFMEIAKLRAARFLWSRILEAHSPDAEDLPPMFIQSNTSRWNQTLYDPHVNILRGTTASMSAILGGTDSLAVSPFDGPVNKNNPFSDRVSRNSQIVLKEESYLDKVIDPAAGSYYIENLTDKIISGTWDLFLKTEEKGGFIKSLIEGFIQEEVKKIATERLANLSNRKEYLLGTNQYPIFDEKAGGKSMQGVEDNCNEDPLPEEHYIVDPLETFRGARDFEQLRLKTDMHPGKRPVVFIIPLGHLAMRRARAMFTMNFFACAGFEVIDNIARFSTVAEGMAEAEKAGADIVVLCSSDDEYPEMAANLVSMSGNKIIPVIAGYPKEHLDTLKEAGIKHFIHVRSNLLDELKNYQKLLGI